MALRVAKGGQIRSVWSTEQGDLLESHMGLGFYELQAVAEILLQQPMSNCV